MKRKEVIFIAILFIVATAFTFYYQGFITQEVREVCINDTCFKVEIADSTEERALGLMQRETLESDEGMLFIFENEGIHGFWMKNTLIPLDIVWLNEEKKVVHIKEMALPCLEEECEVFYPGEKTRFVLEVNAGMSEKFKIKEGDLAEFK